MVVVLCRVIAATMTPRKEIQMINLQSLGQ